MDKESTCNTADTRDAGWIPRLERSPGGGHGNSLQYSCLENTMERSLTGYSPKACEESDMTEHKHGQTDYTNYIILIFIKISYVYILYLYIYHL